MQSADGNDSVQVRPSVGQYSKKNATNLLSYDFDKDAILKKRLPYERLHQLTIDILTGVR